jgi:hypothetical protein
MAFYEVQPVGFESEESEENDSEAGQLCSTDTIVITEGPPASKGVNVKDDGDCDTTVVQQPKIQSQFAKPVNADVFSMFESVTVHEQKPIDYSDVSEA